MDDIKIKNYDSIMDLKLENVEIQTKQCKICKEYLARIRDGSFNAKDHRWRGIDGDLWNGLSCPKCHKAKVAKRLRDKNVKDSK